MDHQYMVVEDAGTDDENLPNSSALTIINNYTKDTQILTFATSGSADGSSSTSDHVIPDDPTFITTDGSTTCMVFEADGIQEEHEGNGNVTLTDSDTSEGDSSMSTMPTDTVIGPTTACAFVSTEEPFRFLSTDDAIQNILNVSPSDVLPCVPDGIKNNVRYMIDFTANIGRQKSKRRVEHHDDCGYWIGRSCTTTKSYFALSADGSKKKYHLRDGVYCVEKVVNKKATMCAVSPQPNEEDMLTVCRYYQTLRADPTYKKRTTWLDYSQEGRNAPKVAIVEYSGIYPHKYPVQTRAKINRNDLANSSRKGSSTFFAEEEDISLEREKNAKSSSDGPQRLAFCTTEQLLHAAKNASKDNILPRIPQGPKNNVRFVVDNSLNIERVKNSKRMEHRDDCGAWFSKSCTATKTQYMKISPNGDLRTIKMISKICYYPKKVKKKVVWLPKEPQPKAEDIVTLHRYYQTLKMDQNYKKRTSWFESSMLSNIHPVAIVEYSGEYPLTEKPMHGNCKRKEDNLPYVRCNPLLMNKIKSRVRTQKPSKVFEDLKVEAGGDDDLAPRDLKQIRQMKYNLNKPPSKPRPSVPEEVLMLSNMVRNHTYVQQYIQTKGEKPLLILYSDQQLKDFQSFLNAKSFHVVGIDHIPCDGPFQITAVLYRNLKILNASTHTHPVMVGPIFIHSESSVHDYNRFFCHLSSIMTTPPPGFEINIRGEEDAAIARAIDTFCPGVEQFFCTKHLADNVTLHLRVQIGLLPSDVDTITHEIFGSQGLVKINDVTEFEDKSSTLMTATEEVYPEFVEYFMGHIKPLLLDNIKRPYTGNAFRNNSQAINNHLQLSINWKITKASDLVEGLYGVIQQQIVDMRDALSGQGSYSLVPQYGQHAVTRKAWTDMSQEEMDAHLERFLVS